MKKIWTFVITGGPCSGKTTGMSIIEQELSNLGYYVLIIPETATELISTGIRPFGKSLDIFTFQHVVLKKQIQKEQLYQEVAQKLPYEKIVIILDRGIVDSKIYVSEEQFQQLLEQCSLSEVEARDRYDAVLHLVTAADGAEEFYTLSNNEARTETAEEARKLDKLGISCWTGHPRFRVINNSTNFEGKMEKLLNEIYSVLGEPIPLEIERKYLIEKPKLETLAKQTDITVVDIVQTYLKSENNSEIRVRQRGQNGSFSYYFTEKRKISPTKRIELERRITEKEYIRYLASMDTSRNSIVKKRICFVYNAQYFEVDLFEFSDDKAVMEIELTNENSTIDLPKFINVICEVTDDPKYQNYNIAKTQTL